MANVNCRACGGVGEVRVDGRGRPTSDMMKVSGWARCKPCRGSGLVGR